MLMMIYDKHGEPFEVRPDVAKTLIINQGWSPSPTVASLPLFEPRPSPTPTPTTPETVHPAPICNPQVTNET